MTKFFIEKDYIVIPLIGLEGKNAHALEKALEVCISTNKENGEVLIMGREVEETKKAPGRKIQNRQSLPGEALLSHSTDWSFQREKWFDCKKDRVDLQRSRIDILSQQ